MTTRVLILIKGLGRGGAEQLLVNAARCLDRDAFDYRIGFLLPHKDALVGELRGCGVRAVCLDGDGAIAWLWRLRRLVRRERIDVVHVHSPVAAIGARLVLTGRRPKIVYTEHNVWERYHPATYWANVLTFWRNSQVFAVSEQVRRSISYPRWLRALPMPPIETLYHGPAPGLRRLPEEGRQARASLGIEADAPMVIHVANFKAHKAHDVLLRAATRVRERVPGVRFVLVGTGQLEGEVRSLARDLQLNGSVVFAGLRDDVPALMSTSDVFVLPSDYEGLSIALLEAMTLGLPAVVTDVGGLAEAVSDGVDGIVIPPRDETALEGALVRVLEDPDLRGRLGEGARLRAAEFDIAVAVRRMEEVYARLGR